MKTRNIFFINKIVYLFFILLFISQNNIFSLNTSNPKGSATVYALGSLEPYTASSEVWGWVNYHGGFSVASTVTVKMGISPHVKVGDITLFDGACLELLADLDVSTNSGIIIGSAIGDAGYIIGNEGALIFHGDTLLPSHKNLYFLDDTIIDCQSNWMTFSTGSQLIVDSNTTLTLRNMHLSGLTGQASTVGGIVLKDETSVLALQNVIVDIDGTYTFDIGSLYIHEDVIFTGSVHGDIIYTQSVKRSFVHSSLYDSPQTSLIIDKNSTLYFDSGITFVYDHQSAASNICRQQLVMTDTTSTLFLNGSILSVPAYSSGKSGLELWLGTLILDNRVTFSNYNQSVFQVNTENEKGISFGKPPEDLNVFVLGGCRTDIYGTLNYYNRG